MVALWWTWPGGGDAMVIYVVVVVVSVSAVGRLVEVEVVVVEDVDVFAAVVSFGWWLVGLRAVGLRRLRGRGGGSNIRGCIKSDQGGGEEGGQSGGSGVWYGCGMWSWL